jgi:hypothetical protein
MVRLAYISILEIEEAGKEEVILYIYNFHLDT